MAPARWTAGCFLSSAGVSEVLAEALLAHSPSDVDEYAAVLTLARSVSTEAELAHSLHEGGACERIARLLLPKLHSLIGHHDAGLTPHLEPKFSGAMALHYGGLDDFFGGLEKRIGAPSPKVLETMEDEHTRRVDADTTFTTGNYGIETTSKIEWAFVVEPTEQALVRLSRSAWPAETDEALRVRGRCRMPRPLADFEDVFAEHNCKLQMLQQPQITHEELIGGRMYTGPMYQKYNAVLRGRGQTGTMRDQYVRLCAPAYASQNYLSGKWEYEDIEAKINSYTTTLHAINSVVLKASKLTMSTRVYRGLSGATLPDEFFRKNEFGVAGGVEHAFMSTTTSREVAMGYASQPTAHSAAGIVFEIPMGMVDRGADIAWLSQYPHEREILCGPLSGLEVHSYRVDGALLIIEMKLSINLASLTMEQVICKRRKVVQDMCEQFLLRLGTRDICGSPWREFCRTASVRHVEVNSLLRRWLDAISGEDPEHYNEDSQLADAISDAVLANTCIAGFPEGFSELLRDYPQAIDLEVFRLKPTPCSNEPNALPIGIAALVFASCGLRELHLDYAPSICKLGPRDAAMLAGVLAHSSSCQLHTLSLRDHEIGARGTGALAAALSRNRTLTSLDVCGNNYANDGGDLSGIFRLSQHVPQSSLRHLNLDGAWLHVPQLTGCEPTVDLDLSRRELRVGSAAVVAACVAINPVSKSLDMSGNKLCNEGIRVIGEQLAHNTSLTELNLSGNDNIGEAGQELVAAARRRMNSALKKVSFTDGVIWVSCDGEPPRPLPNKKMKATETSVLPT